MKLIKEVYPKWGEYYIVIVSLFEGNPKHKVIIFVDECRGDNLVFTTLTYEENNTYRSKTLPYFELVEKINMRANEMIKD